jgi:HAD superfamily hydrolase (TIGR01509 family)
MLSSILFDAGNTLFFPDLSRTLAPLAAAGFSASREQLYAAERFAKKRLDAARGTNMTVREIGQSVDHDYWRVYYTHLTQALGAPIELVPACIASTRRSDHWTRVLPGTQEVLRTLRGRGLRLGVISNSDGGIANALRSAGLGDEFFDSYTDSGNVGVEKPDPAIFRMAVESLGTLPEACLCVGDTYSVDFVGAQNAGLHAILMDPAGVYRDDPYGRMESLEELPELLSSFPEPSR